MIYINTFTHKIVNSVNAIPNKKVSIDYAVTDTYTFALLDKDGKRLIIDDTASYYLVGDTNFITSDTPCFFSDDYTIDLTANTITFTLDTYTAGYFAKITNKDSSMWLEMAVKGTTDSTYKVILQDECLAQPRVYLNETPPEHLINEYYTKNEIDEIVEGITVGNANYEPGEGIKIISEVISVDTNIIAKKSDLNFASEIEFQNYQSSTDVSIQTINNDISELEGALSSIQIPTKTSELENDSSFINESEFQSYQNETETTLNSIEESIQLLGENKVEKIIFQAIDYNASSTPIWVIFQVTKDGETIVGISSTANPSLFTVLYSISSPSISYISIDISSLNLNGTEYVQIIYNNTSYYTFLNSKEIVKVDDIYKKVEADFVKKNNVGDLNFTNASGIIINANGTSCAYGGQLFTSYNGKKVTIYASQDLIELRCGSQPNIKTLLINASDILYNNYALNTANGLVKLNSSGKLDLSLIDLPALKAALDALT